MLDKKKEMKNEIKKNLKNIVVLGLAVLLINLNVSITTMMNFTTNSKIIWTLDLGIYSALFSMILSIINYFVKVQKLHINVELLSKPEDVNELKIGEEPRAIRLKITLDGKCREILEPLEVNFPEWLDVQCKPSRYLIFNETSNKAIIDLNHLLAQKEYIKKTESITFDLIANSEEKNEELVDADFRIKWYKKWFSINFESKGIHIKVK
ncbi:hypothetical protein COL72_08430 [Bacillus toyonensis]|uniref:hypothetical protein n=1 Tax=Bacillus toyonensis TaxID=155322 RepID=UPI000BF6D61C|nr:hypothetical protein [Bacillus toyonensis]PFZ73689.1 hypothetical protein COL72_08430 [Bacillus toyonensis]